MSTNRDLPSPDAPSADGSVFPALAVPGELHDVAPAAFLPAHPEERPGLDPGEDEDASRRTPKRIGWIDGHLPDTVDPLTPADPDTAFTQTRRLRHDGWTPERMRLFLSRLAECGVVAEACQAAGMSARAAYNVRDRDPLFAAGWDAASMMARPRLADEAYSRAINGVIERIYKDGAIVAERHRYDNRLTMSVLARLDARLDRAEERGEAHVAVAARWAEFVDAIGEDRREHCLALLAPPAAHSPEEEVGDRELHELSEGANAPSEPRDPHKVWEENGRWWTNYPPPADYQGRPQGHYGEGFYRRRLTPAEQAVIDAREAEKVARAAAARDAWFELAGPGEAPR